MTRGDSGKPLPGGRRPSPVSQAEQQTEFDDIANTFDTADPGGEPGQILEGFGNAFAGRGASLNQAIRDLNPLFANLQPVAKALTDADTRLERFFPELADAAGIVAPVAEENAELFSNGATLRRHRRRPGGAQGDRSPAASPRSRRALSLPVAQRPFLATSPSSRPACARACRRLRSALPIAQRRGRRRRPGAAADAAGQRRPAGAMFTELEELVEQPADEDDAAPPPATPSTRRLRLANWVVPLPDGLQLLELLVHVPARAPHRAQARRYAQRVSAVDPAFRAARTGRSPATPMDDPGWPATARLAARRTAGAGDRQPATPAASSSRHELPILHGNPYGPSDDRGRAELPVGPERLRAQGEAARSRASGRTIPRSAIPNIPSTAGRPRSAAPSSSCSQDGARTSARMSHEPDRKRRLSNCAIGLIAIVLIVVGFFLAFTKSIPFTERRLRAEGRLRRTPRASARRAR